MSDRIEISVDRDGWTKQLQLQIAQLDENDAGTGYRLAGPKYNGSGETLLSHVLGERDAREIRAYLDRAFPQTVYRAEYVDGFTLGLYTTRDAARQHCTAFMEREEPYVTSADWHSEEDDGPESLVIVVGGHEIETGYIVTPLTVASGYDPDGDE